MDQLDKKRPLNDMPASSVDEVTTPVKSVQPAAKAVPKEKHSKAFSFVSVLFLLMLLVAGVMTYLWYNQKSEVDSLTNDMKAAETTVSNLRTELGKLNQQTTKPDDAVTQEAPVVSDSDQIKKLVVANEHARIAAVNATYTVGVPKIQGVFASVAVNSAEGPGWRCVLKKVDGLWLILFCGQSSPEQSDLDKWGVPAGFLNS